MTSRLSVNVNDDTAVALRTLAAKEDTTVTEIVRRAVSVYKFLEHVSYADADGTTIQIFQGSIILTDRVRSE